MDPGFGDLRRMVRASIRAVKQKETRSQDALDHGLPVVVANVSVAKYFSIS